MHSTVLRSSETGGYNDMQCTLFGHDGGVLRRLPSRFGVGEVVAIVSRVWKFHNFRNFTLQFHTLKRSQIG